MAEAGTGAPAAENSGAITNPSQGQATLTQEQVNSIVAAERRKIEAHFTTQLEALKTASQPELEALRAETATLKETLDAVLNPEPTGEELPPWEEYRQALQFPSWCKSDQDKRRWENSQRQSFEARTLVRTLVEKVSGLESTVEEEKKNRTAAEQRAAESTAARQEAEKAAFLASLSVDPEVDPISPDAIPRYFNSNLVFEPKTQLLMFKCDDGTLMRPREGIIKNMPTWMKKSTLQSGGSGSGGSNAQAPDPAAELAAATAEYEETKAASQADPRNNTLQQRFVAARRKKLTLEQQQKAA